MSNALDKAREKIMTLKESINKIVQQTFEEYKDLIVHYNADMQMYDKGQDSKGSIIRPAYKPITIRIKKAKGQPTDRVTLRDTGRFHRTLIVTPKAEYVEITSDVEYAKHLFTKYGSDILGIQEEILKEFVKRYVVPNIKEVSQKTLKR